MTREKQLRTAVDRLTKVATVAATLITRGLTDDESALAAHLIVAHEFRESYVVGLLRDQRFKMHDQINHNGLGHGHR